MHYAPTLFFHIALTYAIFSISSIHAQPCFTQEEVESFLGAIQEEQDADPQPAEPQPSVTKRKAAHNDDAKPHPKAQKKAPDSGAYQWQAN